MQLILFLIKNTFYWSPTYNGKYFPIRQTVVIIVSYVLCSTPAVGLQLWVIWIEKSDNLSE